jgi:hypothetical protein
VRDLGDFLAEGGAIVAAARPCSQRSAVVGGSVVRDFRPHTDPEQWARRGGYFGGGFGLGVLLFRDVQFGP